LPLKEGLVFNVTASAYRHGVLDKTMSIAGEAIDGAMSDTGLKVGDMVNGLDEATEPTVMKMDRLMEHSGPLLRLAASDVVMSLVSRVLDLAFVKKAMVGVMRRRLAKALIAQQVATCSTESLRGGVR
jgi:hypothetical protein